MRLGRLFNLMLVSLMISSPAMAAGHDDHPTAATELGKGRALPEAGGAVKISKVFFITPKDGETVAKEFTAKFAVEGLKVAKAGEIVPGTGHFHILVDTPAIAEGQMIPMDAKHLHYGQGQTEAKLTLSPGPHTLILQFADGAHRAYTKMLTQEIKITVK